MPRTEFMAKISKHTDSKPTQQEIAERAREIYEQSGRIPDRDLENWLAAEAQLTGGRSVAKPARNLPKNEVRSNANARASI